ncbi:MAG: nicotinate (nicotinamide) nucleotide adenylyltransferase [Planctomycetaceae bacterium]|nr:nicotinate-nucleotide adenylyltransferase [Planctomycetales bacterium]MCB9920707.1 nicotinate (nicotinamide) nucleotide adenylyltransferase [Planctomycetaceae bacterium]
MTNKLGVFGGSFDPIHFGHLLLAESCREQCALDQVLFVPAAVAPHKQSRTMTSARDRIEMLRLAIGGHEQLAVSTIEIDRGGVSYTVDTLAALAEQYVGSSLFFLMGADSLKELPTWREPHRLCELAVPLVVRRAGSPEPDFSVISHLVGQARLDEIREHQVEMPIVELSSTEMRRRVAARRSIRYRTPRAVEKYIETHGLYRSELP